MKELLQSTMQSIVKHIFYTCCNVSMKYKALWYYVLMQKNKEVWKYNWF